MNCCFMLKRCLLKFVSWCWKSSRMFCKVVSVFFFTVILTGTFSFLPSLFFSLTTVSVVHCVKKTLACMSPSLATGKSLFLQTGHSLYIQSFEFESQHTDSAISSKSVPPMNRRECSFSTRKPRFSCTLQRHDSLSAMDGWATQNGRIRQNKEYEILQSGLSRRNLLCRFFMVSFKNLFCFFIFPSCYCL